MGIKLIILWVLNLADYITTQVGIYRYGLWIEENPYMREILAEPLTGFLYKILGMTLICLLFYILRKRIITNIGVWFLLIVYMTVVVNNVAVLLCMA